jgi:hypothetical protein
MPLTRLENVPNIMRAKGWLNGASLLEIWFSRPAARKPAYGPPDITTIKMDNWFLTLFPAPEQCTKQSSMRRSGPQNRLRELSLTSCEKLGSSRSADHFAQWPFGNLGLPAEKLHELHVNRRPVHRTIPNLDDLTAALGNFSIYVSVAGFVRHASTRPAARPKGTNGLANTDGVI